PPELLDGRRLLREGTEVREQLLPGPVIAEQDLDERLRLDARRRTLGLQPALECTAALCSDRVERSRALPNHLYLGAGESSVHQSRRLGVAVALSPRPDVMQAPPHLLGEFVRRPGPGREQTEDRVARRRQLAAVHA